MGDGTEPVGDDEYLYRRIPLVFGPEGQQPSPKAFRPRESDKTGISFFRAKYTSPEQVAANNREKHYYIAVLLAGDLRANGFQIVPRPEGHPPGHAEIPDLTWYNRRTNRAEEAQQLLAQKLCLKIFGPLPKDSS
jgi:hypothetical protein